MNTSVVVCVYTVARWSDILSAIASLQGQAEPPAEVIVSVDHNPQLKARLDAALTEVRIIESDGARGLSGARNTGVKAVRGEIVAFLDDDAIADPSRLASLIEPFKRPEVMVTGGYVAASWDDEHPAWWPADFDWVVGCSYSGLPKKAIEVRNIFAGNMACRQAAFERVGMFSSGLGRVRERPVGCEETEFCIRLQQTDPASRVLFVPAARIRHRLRGDRATWKYYCARICGEGVSKALISVLAGRANVLATEQRYATVVLPRAAIRGVLEAVRGDRHGLERSAALAGGLARTAAGYLRGRAALAVRSPDPRTSLPAFRDAAASTA